MHEPQSDYTPEPGSSTKDAILNSRNEQASDTLNMMLTQRMSCKVVASEGVRRMLRYVESLRDIRTLLTEFFSLLLGRERLSNVTD